jgi:thiosulfate dehydrogenase
VPCAYSAEGDPARGKAIAASGSAGAPACASCHGPNGEGNAQAAFPQLAGLGAPYLRHQLESYEDGSRASAVMEPIAKALKPDQVADVAAWFASLPAPAQSTAPLPEAALLQRGRALAVHGDWGKDLPACFSCHGPGASGAGGAFPRLAGQHASYLAAQIEAWRKGERRNDPQQLMRTSAEKLAPQDIDAVTRYLAALPKSQSAAEELERKSHRPAQPLVYDRDFTPPPEEAIPDNEFGATVRLGEKLFVETQSYAKTYVGNALNCVNCHLDRGRKANSAPMWAAYVVYPAYRKKNDQVNSMQDRIAGCFNFSENGHPPAPNSKEMTALVTYFYWLARGAPTGAEIKGRGYPPLTDPKQKPDAARGGKVFASSCAICHGADGQGTQTQQVYVFPPVWGPLSYNKGAGMARVETAAAFIHQNMPLGQGERLSEQEAWDVAAFINSKPRPADPRTSRKDVKTPAF